jgi:uncharacterized membrane-anchored protein
MKDARLLLTLALVTITCVLVRDAAAYIDPGTGSYAFQIIIAFAVASGFAIKMHWRYIWKSFRGRRRSDGKHAE